MSLEGGREAFELPAPGPLLLILTGPSGVGKDAVLERLRAENAPRHFVVSATTRQRREGERDGADYHFLTVERFEELRAQGQFVETATVYGNLYGVPRWEIEGPLKLGEDVLMRTDVQGATTLKRIIPDAVVVFLAPESVEELMARLALRGTESPDDVAHRLTFAAQECALIPTFDYVVVNRRGALDATVAAVEAILTAERARTHPRQVRLP